MPRPQSQRKRQPQPAEPESLIDLIDCEDPVDESSEESFPASDPPSFVPTSLG